MHGRFSKVMHVLIVWKEGEPRSEASKVFVPYEFNLLQHIEMFSVFSLLVWRPFMIMNEIRAVVLLL